MKPEMERQLRQWLLATDPEPFDGMDERGRRIYRRQVQRSLRRGVRAALKSTRKLVPVEQLDELIGRWMEESPPKTRLYWRLPLEFAQWVREKTNLPHPAVGDLVHWEAVKLDVRNAPDHSDTTPLFDEPRPEHGAVFAESARLGIYEYPVFRLDDSAESFPEASEVPLFIIAYRGDETVRWRRLAPQVAQILGRLAAGDTIDAGISFLEELYGDVDTTALLEELTALRRRGALRGFSSASGSTD